MTNWKKNDFETVEGGAIISVGNRGKAKGESEIYIINKKRNDEGRMEQEKGKHMVLGWNRSWKKLSEKGK